MQVGRELALRGVFYYTVTPEILSPPPSKLPALLVLKDGVSIRYDGSLSSHSLYKWVMRERHPALPMATVDTLRQFIVSSDSRRLVVLAVDNDPSLRRIAQKK